MKVDFEQAKAADAPAVYELYAQLVKDPNLNVTPEQITAVADDAFNFLFVGRLEGQVIATAFLTLCRDVMYGNQPYAVVENLVVAPSARRSKVGSELMAFLKGFCKSKNCTKIMLLSNAQRIEAHAFFEKCGYRSDLKIGFVNYINRE